MIIYNIIESRGNEKCSLCGFDIVKDIPILVVNIGDSKLNNYFHIHESNIKWLTRKGIEMSGTCPGFLEKFRRVIIKMGEYLDEICFKEKPK